MRTYSELFALTGFRALFVNRLLVISSISMSGLALGTIAHASTGSARHGGGARRRSVGARTDSPIRVGDLDELGRALVGTGFAYRPAKRAAQARVLSRVLPQVRDVRRLGSAAIDLCLVADGRLDGYYESGLHPWDLAAGWLIVEEAGGWVTGGDLADPSERLVVAANPALLPRLANLLAGSE